MVCLILVGPALLLCLLLQWLIRKKEAERFPYDGVGRSETLKRLKR